MFESSVMIKDGHELARAGLSASRISACENLARLRLACWSFGPKKWARPELAKKSSSLSCLVVST
jgi:hypothetical protein